MDGPSVPPASVRNSPAAVAVLVRHLAKGTRARRWAAAALAHARVRAPRSPRSERGELAEAERLAASAGPVGAVLRRVVAGEIGLVTPAAPGPTRRPSPPAARGRGAAPGDERAAGDGRGLHGPDPGHRQRPARRGLDVHVATRIGFPVTKGHLGAAARVTVDGIEHHRRCRPGCRSGQTPRWPRDIELTARLVALLRPAVLHAHSNHVNAQVALALRRALRHPGRLRGPRLPRGDLAQPLERPGRRIGRRLPAGPCRRDAVPARGRRGRHPQRGDARGDRRPWRRPGQGHGRPQLRRRSPWRRPVRRRPRRHRRADRSRSAPVGTLNGYEGIDVLVDAVARLRRAGHAVHLRVVGDGPERAALEKRTADRGIADATTFTGRVPHDEVVAQHRAIDVFCVPRHDLPVTRLVPPLKPVEAMALGRPVVASDLPPLREIVTNGVPGRTAGCWSPPETPTRSPRP